MSIIAIVNRKGGSGKTTLATHLAAALTHAGQSVMLGDVDRQQSCRQWLARRAANASGAPRLSGWVVDPQRVLRPPAGISHVVLDTPGGLRGFDLARLMAKADLVLIPVCESAFDLESAADCLAEMRVHPRVASGLVQLAVVGMRTDARASGALRAWATGHGAEYLGAIPTARVYPHCASRGLTVFDLQQGQSTAVRAHWQPVMDGLARLLALQAQLSQLSRHRAWRPVDALSAEPQSAPAAQIAVRSAAPEGAPEPQAAALAPAAAQPVASPAHAPRPTPPALPWGGWLQWLGALCSPVLRRREASR